MTLDSTEDSEPRIRTTDRYQDIEDRLTQNTDTLYVVNYWATWCKPCVEELPYFTAFEEKHKDSKIKVILVSLDFPGQEGTTLIPFLRKHQISSEVWHMTNMNYNSWLNQVDPRWSGALPATQARIDQKRLFVEGSFHSVSDIEMLVRELSEGN